MQLADSPDGWGVRRFESAPISNSRPVLMITRRRVPRALQDDFLRVLGKFSEFVATFPGLEQTRVLCQETEGDLDCVIAHRFKDAASRARFTCASCYQIWLDYLQVLTRAEEASAPLKEPLEEDPPPAPTWRESLFRFGLLAVCFSIPTAIWIQAELGPQLLELVRFISAMWTTSNAPRTEWQYPVGHIVAPLELPIWGHCVGVLSEIRGVCLPFSLKSQPPQKTIL